MRYKTAAVTSQLKALRRAMQMLQRGDYSWHGTPRSVDIMRQGAIEPSQSNLGRGVYMGAGAPDLGWSSGNNAILGVPTKQVLSGPATNGVSPQIVDAGLYTERGATSLGREGLTGLTEAQRDQALRNPRWAITPNSVPLGKGGVFVASPTTPTEAVDRARAARMRVIPKSAFNDALGRFSPNSDLQQIYASGNPFSTGDRLGRWEQMSIDHGRPLYPPYVPPWKSPAPVQSLAPPAAPTPAPTPASGGFMGGVRAAANKLGLSGAWDRIKSVFKR